MLKRTFTIDLEPMLKNRIHDGNLMGAQFIINEIRDDEKQAFYKMLGDWDLKSIDGAEVLEKDGVWLLHEKSIKASKFGFPRYSIFREVIGNKRFVKLQCRFFEFKIDAFCPVPDGEDTRGAIVNFVASEICEQDESMLRTAVAMDNIDNNNDKKMNYFQAMVMKRFWNSWRGKDSDIDPKKTYTFKQLTCTLNANPILDNLQHLKGEACEIVLRLTGKKHLSWWGFGMPGLEYSGYGAQCAPECWFCPENSWNNCPKRAGKHENNGDFTIDDIMAKYREVAKILGPRANGIGDTIYGEIEKVRFEYQVIARFEECHSDTRSKGSGGSYGDNPVGIYIPATESDARKIPHYYGPSDRSNDVTDKFAAQMQADVMKTERALKYISKTPKSTKYEKYMRTVDFRMMLPIAIITIKGDNAEYPIGMADMQSIAPKPGDTIQVSFFKSEISADKTLQILDFKTDSTEFERVDGTWEYHALKTSRQKFEDFLRHNAKTEEKFLQHLLSASGRARTERLNQNFR